MIESINSAIRWARERIECCSDSARLDAELLLAHCLGKSRSYLYSWPQKELSPACWQQFQELVERRIEPTPIAYLLGSREFYSLQFSTAAKALVPRPETELLVDMALQKVPLEKSVRICDLGTGSGIIAIALKVRRPLAEVYATDVDPACLELAREKGPAPIMDEDFVVTAEMLRRRPEIQMDGYTGERSNRFTPQWEEPSRNERLDQEKSLFQ